MSRIDAEVDYLYNECGVSKNRLFPPTNSLNCGTLNNNLHSDLSAFKRNSVFSYSACGASSVGRDWLNKNGYIK